MTLGSLVLLVTPFRANGEVDHLGSGVGDIEVDAGLPLPVATEIERGRRVGTERGIDGVGDEQTSLVSPDRAAHVPDEAGRSEATDADNE